MIHGWCVGCSADSFDPVSAVAIDTVLTIELTRKTEHLWSKYDVKSDS